MGNNYRQRSQHMKPFIVNTLQKVNKTIESLLNIKVGSPCLGNKLNDLMESLKIKMIN